MIPLFKPFVAAEAAEAVASVLASGYIGEGTKVKQFEQALRSWIGPAVTTNSGTSALWLAYELAGLGPQSTVVCTAMSCLATAIPFAYLGCRVEWADVDPHTGLIDVADVEKTMRKTRVHAVVCVDYGGQVCDLPALRKLCDAHGAVLIEDAAHSFGAYGQGMAHMAAYSFQAIKHLTTGDGGALVCQDEQLRERARLKRWFGLDRQQGGFRCEQTVEERGLKAQMNDIAAAIGLANLGFVDNNITRCRRHTAAYEQAGFGHVSQSSSCWLYTMIVANRQEFIEEMAKKGIQCARVHTRIDKHPIFHVIRHRHLPGVELFDEHQCSIPVGWYLEEEDVQRIIEAVRECVE